VPALQQKLTDLAVKNAKPNGERARKLADANGLYLHIETTGAKYWRYRFRTLDGRERVAALGIYPLVTLADARKAHLEARRLVSAGEDPVAVKQAAKRDAQTAAASTFEVVARAWHAKKATEWTPLNMQRVLRRMEIHLFPDLGALPVAEIKPKQILGTLRKIEATGLFETAHRCLSYVKCVLQLAREDELIESLATEAISHGALTAPADRNYSRVKPDEIGALCRAIDAANLFPTTRLGLAFVLLTAVRSCEARGARWVEFDLQHGRWTIPGERMKMGAAHIVPLSRQALALLMELREHSGEREFLFPNHNRPQVPMSENAMLYALNRAGYAGRQTVHGFRGLFSTVANESGEWDADVIELCLAHQSGNAVRRAYNSAQRLADRTRLMQWWADYLDRSRAGAEVVVINRPVILKTAA